ncbi:MAG TPA: DinB family protein [Thermomicrobiales bacterium]|mgnify:CR=1 FL=1|nr:DinB family protein [Thermomicrobiales bacterium]
MDLLDRLLGHDKATTDELLQICEGLTDAQWNQEFDISWKSLHGTAGHVIYNERTWTNLMMGLDAATVGDDWTYTLPDLRRHHDTAHADLVALARGVRLAGSWEDTFVDTLDVPPTRKTLGGGILHVITHNMVHRTEMLHILARLGLDNLPEGDLMAWDMAQTIQKGVI